MNYFRMFWKNQTSMHRFNALRLTTMLSKQLCIVGNIQSRFLFSLNIFLVGFIFIESRPIKTKTFIRRSIQHLETDENLSFTSLKQLFIWAYWILSLCGIELWTIFVVYVQISIWFLHIQFISTYIHGSNSLILLDVDEFLEILKWFQLWRGWNTA